MSAVIGNGNATVVLQPADVPAIVQMLRVAMGISMNGNSGTSQNENTNHANAARKDVEKTLMMLESRPGFASCLADIIANNRCASLASSINVNDNMQHNGGSNNKYREDKEFMSVRWLASVHLKNVCSRQWRREHVHAKQLSNIDGERRGIDDNEKEHLRRMLLEIVVREESDAIAMQVH